MFFELRIYRLLPGKRDEWVRLMDEEIIPFQLSKGMVILASFVDEINDRYIWIRRFESVEEKEALYEATYRSGEWEARFSKQVGELIDRSSIEVVNLTATPRSFMR